MEREGMGRDGRERAKKWKGRKGEVRRKMEGKGKEEGMAREGKERDLAPQV